MVGFVVGPFAQISRSYKQKTIEWGPEEPHQMIIGSVKFQIPKQNKMSSLLVEVEGSVVGSDVGPFAQISKSQDQFIQ